MAVNRNNHCHLFTMCQEESVKFMRVHRTLLTLNIVINRYTDEISKLAILAKLPVPKKAILKNTNCKNKIK